MRAGPAARLPAMKIVTAVLALLLLVRTAQAGQLEDGIAAYEAKDYDAAKLILMPLAQDGDASAQFYVGVLYAFGYGVELNESTAADWFELSAAQGNAKAQFNAGRAYYKGVGRQIDLAKALAYFEASARQCLAESQAITAGFYWSGKGAEKSKPLGYAWALIAYETGEQPAAATLVAYMPTEMSEDEQRQANKIYLSLREELGCSTASSPP